MFQLNKKLHFTSISMIVIGLLSLVIGFMSDAHSTWTNLLFNNYFFLGISLFAVVFVAIQYVAEAGWSTVFKRVPEAMMAFLPYAGIIMLFIVIAAVMHWNHIYHWLEPGIMDPNEPNYDKIIAGKEPYLNAPFFLIRSIVYVIIWIYCARKLRQLSIKGDLEGDIGERSFFKGLRVSGWFLVFFAVTSCTAAWDWIMSIDTHWFSTLFGWYIFSEWATIGFTTILLIALFLQKTGHLPDLNDSHIHDLGKFIFAFSIVWTYMWFSQFMLIWYANIPEEVTYFITRLEDYQIPFFGMLVMNFILPFLILINSDFKRLNWIIVTAGIIILIGHYMDVFNMIMPSAVGDQWSFGIPELGSLMFFTGLFVYIVFDSLTKAPLEAAGDPLNKESEKFVY